MCITNGDIFSITAIWVNSVAHERAKITANKHNDGFQPRTWINDHKQPFIVGFDITDLFYCESEKILEFKAGLQPLKGMRSH